MKQIIILIVAIGFSLFPFAQQNITEIEYYFDTEPNVGNAISLSVTTGNTISETYNFDISALDTGFHFIYFRAKNDQNVWGLYDKKVFYISEPFVGTNTTITNVEYYFDVEPNTGNATSLSLTSGNTINETYNFDISALDSGFHFVYFRVKNDQNIWGLYDKKVFYISEPFVGTNTTITDAEYYFDTDPGIGNATNIGLPSPTNNQYSFNLTASNLSQGDHLLFIRVKNNLNVWSLYDVVVFTVDGSLAITDNQFNNSITIYPNPVKDKITITSTNTITSYKVIDITGKTILESNMVSHSIDTNMLETGTYFLILKSEKNTSVKKIIKY